MSLSDSQRDAFAQFANVNNNYLVCGVCNQLPVQVVDTECCSALFCWECISQQQVCPSCNVPISVEKVHANVPIQRILDRMQFPCRLGCKTMLTPSQRPLHEKNCDFQIVSCPYSYECRDLFLKDLQYHLTVCPDRQVQCKCDMLVPFSAMQDHYEICIEFEVACPHGCSKMVKRIDINKHSQEECENTHTLCEFAEHGCMVAPLRKHYEKHLEENTNYHMGLMNKTIKKQAEEIQELKKQVHQPPAPAANAPANDCQDQCREQLSKAWNGVKKDMAEVHEYARKTAKEIGNYLRENGRDVARRIPCDAVQRLAPVIGFGHVFALAMCLLIFSVFVPDFIVGILCIFSIFKSVQHLVAEQWNVEKFIRWSILSLSTTMTLYCSRFLCMTVYNVCILYILYRVIRVML